MTNAGVVTEKKKKPSNISKWLGKAKNRHLAKLLRKLLQLPVLYFRLIGSILLHVYLEKLSVNLAVRSEHKNIYFATDSGSGPARRHPQCFPRSPFPCGTRGT